MNYEPTRKEVYGEMFRNFKDSSAKSLKEFVEYAAVTGGLMSVIPYCIPTAIREFKKPSSGSSQKLTSSENIGTYIGLIGGLAADVGQLYAYGYLAKHGHLEALAFPILTNTVSGLYEIKRSLSAAYENARNRLAEKRK